MEYDVMGLQDVTMVHTVIPEEISVEPFQKTNRLFLLSVDLDPTTAKKSFDKGSFSVVTILSIESILSNCLKYNFNFKKG